MPAHFSLSDIDAETPAKSAPESSKPRIPNLRSKSAKKRKTDEIIDLSDPAADIVKAAELIAKCYYEKVEVIDDLKKIGQVRAAAHDRDSAELVKVKKELKDTKSLLNKHIAEADNRAVETKKMLVEEMKKDAAIAIFEARILMATEAASNGFDTSLWAVETWKTKLAKLKAQDPETAINLEDTSSKAPKAAKGKSAKVPKPVSAKAPKPTSDDAPKALEEKAVEDGNNEDVAMADQDPVTEVVKDLATVAADGTTDGGDTLGEEGI